MEFMREDAEKSRQHELFVPQAAQYQTFTLLVHSLCIRM